jgi:hypothetical protein
MSKTVLQKLGYKPGTTGWVVGMPTALAAEVDLSTERTGDPATMIGFVSSAAELTDRLATMLPHYRRGAALWFAYPKKSGRIKSDIDRDHGWEALKTHDLLPVTQIAVDDDWTALRFRYRDEIAKLTRKF